MKQYNPETMTIDDVFDLAGMSRGDAALTPMITHSAYKKALHNVIIERQALFMAHVKNSNMEDSYEEE